MDTQVILLLLFLSFWSGTLTENSSECPAAPPKGFSLSISSRKSKTGDWNALAHLRHGNNLNENAQPSTGSWDLNINQIVEKCGEWENVDVTASVTALPYMSAPGYELVPGLGYYKLHTTLKTWPEARQICSEEGGHLAVLNSEEESQALVGIYSLHPNITEGWQNEYTHIGFHDLYEEGKYLTIFGDTLETAGYSNFDPGQPNQGNNANCGGMSRTGGLHDSVCIAKLPFFCEQGTMS